MLVAALALAVVARVAVPVSVMAATRAVSPATAVDQQAGLARGAVKPEAVRAQVVAAPEASPAMALVMGPAQAVVTVSVPVVQAWVSQAWVLAAAPPPVAQAPEPSPGLVLAWGWLRVLG